MDRARRVAQLIEVMRQGEILAAQTALRQSRIAPLPWMRRALEIQAAQERSHVALATVAAGIAGFTHPRGAVPDLIVPLRLRLERDLDAGNLAASLLGLQGVIEHLGETLLEQLGRHAHPAGAVLHALRRKVLAQEYGHVQLGARCLQALAPGTEQADALHAYRALGRDAALQVTGLLDDARLDAAAFWRGVEQRLEDWHYDAQASRTCVLS